MSMRRREFITLVGGTATTWPLAARAQQTAKVPRIGFLQRNRNENVEAFVQALRDLGYIDGRTARIEIRIYETMLDRLFELADEMVKLECDVVMAAAPYAIEAARQATSTIPIVGVDLESDPVANGWARSLARPGGNITGFSSFLSDLAGKRIELVKEMVPGLTRVGALFNMSNAAEPAQWKEMREATAVVGIEAQLLDVRTPADIVSAFDDARKQSINALIVQIDTLTQSNQQLIIELATKHRLPAIFGSREFVDAGGLMSYGVHYPDLYRRAATHVHKIFNGAKPADLPVEQPTRFELVVNLRTARALNLTVPLSILLRADEVIE